MGFDYHEGVVDRDRESRLVLEQTHFGNMALPGRGVGGRVISMRTPSFVRESDSGPTVGVRYSHVGAMRSVSSVAGEYRNNMTSTYTKDLNGTFQPRQMSTVEGTLNSTYNCAFGRTHTANLDRSFFQGSKAREHAPEQFLQQEPGMAKTTFVDNLGRSNFFGFKTQAQLRAERAASLGKRLRVVIFDASSRFGMELTRKCLESDRVISVVAVTKEPLVDLRWSYKLKEVNVLSMNSISSVRNDINGCDVCFACVTMYPQNDVDEYAVEIPLRLARMLSRRAPDARLHVVTVPATMGVWRRLQAVDWIEAEKRIADVHDRSTFWKYGSPLTGRLALGRNASLASKMLLDTLQATMKPRSLLLSGGISGAAVEDATTFVAAVKKKFVPIRTLLTRAEARA